MNKITTNIPQSSPLEWIHSLREFQLDSYFDTQSLGRAYEYISKVEIVSIDNKTIVSIINGTSKYTVEIKLESTDIVGICSCPLDKNCKHMAALILSQMGIGY